MYVPTYFTNIEGVPSQTPPLYHLSVPTAPPKAPHRTMLYHANRTKRTVPYVPIVPTVPYQPYQPYRTRAKAPPKDPPYHRPEDYSNLRAYGTGGP